MSFSDCLTAWLHDLRDRPFDRELTKSEIVARFLSKEHLNSKDIIKTTAFSPRKKTDVSVFRIKGLTEESVWSICDKFVENPEKPRIARADLSVGTIESHNLRVDPNGKPIKRHADILGWLDKEDSWILARRQALAAASTLVKRPESSQHSQS